MRRGFDAVAPDVLWWGGMTEIDTGEGKFYLASGRDAFSRRALGYAMGPGATPPWPVLHCRWRSPAGAARWTA
ncbi:hypothetical protein ACWERW_14340 [Streptomyces sp. NPDC004012]